MVAHPFRFFIQAIRFQAIRYASIRTKTRIGMEGIFIIHSCIPLYTVYLQHIATVAVNKKLRYLQVHSIQWNAGMGNTTCFAYDSDDGGLESDEDGGLESDEDGGLESDDDGGLESDDDGGLESDKDGGLESGEDGGLESDEDRGLESDEGTPRVQEVHTKDEVVHLSPGFLSLGVLFKCHA